MVSQSLLNNTNVQVTSALGGMQVLEYVQDMSVSPSTSKLQYYMSRMNVNKRQLLLNLNGNGYTVQAGAVDGRSDSDGKRRQRCWRFLKWYG